MNAAANPALVTLGQVIYFGITLYVWLIVIRVFLTWISPNPYSPLMRFLSKAADPALNLGRRCVPLTLGGLDFSPVLVIMVLHLGGTVLGRWIISLGLGFPPSVIAPLLAWALVSLLNSIAWLLITVMIIRLIISLVQPSPYNVLVRIIYGMTEPMLAPLRRFFPPGPKGLDLRPLFFLLALILVLLVLDQLGAGLDRWLGQLSGSLG
ncbi:YggT family protein [Deltaproteobacteria bacterium OttesenSCG-928-K17]|nr:YggT family protein [Deltaproteobacteria bacterium OttesenSCG-928-K17]